MRRVGDAWCGCLLPARGVGEPGGRAGGSGDRDPGLRSCIRAVPDDGWNVLPSRAALRLNRCAAAVKAETAPRPGGERGCSVFAVDPGSGAGRARPLRDVRLLGQVQHAVRVGLRARDDRADEVDTTRGLRAGVVPTVPARGVLTRGLDARDELPDLAARHVVDGDVHRRVRGVHLVRERRRAGERIRERTVELDRRTGVDRSVVAELGRITRRGGRPAVLAIRAHRDVHAVVDGVEAGDELTVAVLHRRVVQAHAFELGQDRVHLVDQLAEGGRGSRPEQLTARGRIEVDLSALRRLQVQRVGAHVRQDAGELALGLDALRHVRRAERAAEHVEVRARRPVEERRPIVDALGDLRQLGTA